MPLQRRLPKRGFKSTTLKFNAEITLDDLQALAGEEIDVLTLKACGLVPELARTVKVFLSGSISRKITLKGVLATAGAKAAIEAAGGSVVVEA